MALTDGSPQSIFQLVLLVIFILLAIAGIAMVSLFRSDTSNTAQYPITIWGPPIGDRGDMQVLLNNYRKTVPALAEVTYREVYEATMYRDLLEAWATGKTPDLIIINTSLLIPLNNKLTIIPYEQYPLGTFQKEFISAASVYTAETGLYALPLLVDPLVMYWNRDLFAEAAIAQVPENWDSFIDASIALTTASGVDISRSGTALGEYENILHAKEILSALFFQVGTDIVANKNGVFAVDLEGRERGAAPAQAIRFYTDFANPTKKVYTWNKAMDRSRESFAANKVAMYFGYFSEVSTLAEINPNLNFGVALFPQSIQNTHPTVTYGKMYAAAILNTTPNKARALEVQRALTSDTFAEPLTKLAKLPSARLSALKQNPSNPFSEVEIRSALITRTWPEPDGSVADEIFLEMVNAIVSGKSSIEGALKQADASLVQELERY